MQALSLFLFALTAAAGPISSSPISSSTLVERADNNTQMIEFSNTILAGLEKSFADAADADAAYAAELIANSTTTTTSRLRLRTSSDTRNDLNDGLCDDIILIFARGTGSSGNIGSGVGVAFADALAAAEPDKVIVQGVVPYNNNVLGYLSGGDSTGADSMVALTEKAASQCPSARIVWGGYSQGAQVTHKAASRLPSAYYTRIAGIMLFGDPDNGEAFPGSLNTNVTTFCHSDDPICDGIPLPILGHLTYAENASAAAAIVAGWIG